MKYFVYSSWDGFELFETEQEAKEHAEGILQVEQDNSGDGWHPDVLKLCWGLLKERTVQTNVRQKADECMCGESEYGYDDCDWPDHDWDFICDFELEEAE